MILVEYFEYLVECILRIISINIPSLSHYRTSPEKNRQMKTYKPYNISINIYVSPHIQNKYFPKIFRRLKSNNLNFLFQISSLSYLVFKRWQVPDLIVSEDRKFLSFRFSKFVTNFLSCLFVRTKGKVEKFARKRDNCSGLKAFDS